MTNQDMERRIAEAIHRTAPNDLEAILSRCEMRKGNVIPMTTKRKSPVFRTVMAACLALALLGGSSFLYQQAFAVASVVSLDVNPSIEMRVNKSEKVLSCTPLNEEAKQVLADMNGGADLKNTKLDVAVNAVVGALVRSGYLDSISSAILISVEDSDPQRASKLQQELTSTVDVVLQERASEATVLSQTVQKDTQLEKQAKDNNISTGKAALIDRIIKLNPALGFDALAALTVEELKDLAETGAPAMPIGKEKAISLAKEYAGVTESHTSYAEADAELDDVPPHYEVELYFGNGEYEYIVDGYSGEILRGKAGVAADAPAEQQTPAQSAEQMISEDSAFDIAVKHFSTKYPEADAGSLQRRSVKLDRDDGKLHYDVEFFISGYEVDYKIDAYSGDITSWDTDYEAPRSTSSASASGDIGADKAKAIALSHAGLSEAQVSRLRAEKDKDNGRLEYEVEFSADGMEYDYTIDAATGSILEHEKDKDD